MSEKKVIGIIGGMGPLATADLFEKIIHNTKANCDQAHLRVSIDSNTNIPDRTAALLHGGDDPTEELVKSAKRLESIGAEVLIMPCNTAHNFYEPIAANVGIPVLHMIALTRDALKSRGVKRAALLATDGTIQTGIYQRTFEGSGIELLTPEGDAQKAVMGVIYDGVKADAHPDAYRRDMNMVLSGLTQRGADYFILGCTELPLAAELLGLTVPMIDPTTELARAAIRFCGYTLK